MTIISVVMIGYLRKNDYRISGFKRNLCRLIAGKRRANGPVVVERPAYRKRESGHRDAR